MKKVKKQIFHLDKLIEQNKSLIYDEIGTLSKNLETEIIELTKNLDTEITHRQNSITTTQNNIENVERKIDSRFDKLHDMIKYQIK